MPTGRKRRRVVRKKKGGRRRRRAVTRVTAAGNNFINPRTIVRMKYCDTIAFSTATITFQEHLFRLNSCFDPDRTGTGHQPFGFDQLAALYQRYRVFATSWRVEFAATNDVMQYVVCPVNGTRTFTSLSEVAENPRAMMKSTTYNGGPNAVFRGKKSLPALNGTPSAVYKADDRFQADVGSSPTEVLDLHVCMYNPGGNTVTCKMTVTLILHTEFFDPIPVAQS